MRGPAALFFVTSVLSVGRLHFSIPRWSQIAQEYISQDILLAGVELNLLALLYTIERSWFDSDRLLIDSA